MDATLFNQFREIAYDKAGIHLRDGKETLVAARVAKRQRSLQLRSEREYLEYLKRDESGEEIVHFLDAISTNYTTFLREPDHFEFLAAELERWLGAGQRRFRIWCAASSTGEEPYTLAMTVREVLGKRSDVDAKILATDISTRVLAHARRGVYEEAKLGPVAPPLRAAHFQRVDDNGAAAYEARPELRSLLVFKRLNLAKPPFPMSGPLDFVFCRNVMMYFDNTVRQRLVAEIERLLRPSGFLITGHAETLQGLHTQLSVRTPSIYGRRSAEAPVRTAHAAAR